MIAPTTESFRHLFRMIGWLDYHDSSFVNTNYFGIKVSKGIHVFWMTQNHCHLGSQQGGYVQLFRTTMEEQGWHSGKNTYLKPKFISGSVPQCVCIGSLFYTNRFSSSYSNVLPSYFIILQMSILKMAQCFINFLQVAKLMETIFHSTPSSGQSWELQYHHPFGTEMYAGQNMLT